MSCEEDVWASKDPSEVLDYAIDWRKELRELDTIVSSAVTVSNFAESGLVIDSDNLDGTVHTVKVSGGNLDTTAKVRFKIVTSAGRTEYQTMDLPIRTR